MLKEETKLIKYIRVLCGCAWLEINQMTFATLHRRLTRLEDF